MGKPGSQRATEMAADPPAPATGERQGPAFSILRRRHQDASGDGVSPVSATPSWLVFMEIPKKK